METKIEEEVQWLQNAINIFIHGDEISHLGCKQCFLRKLALLIVSGQIEAAEITKSPPLKSFWLKGGRHGGKKKIHHGGEWHSTTMEKIENHFLTLGFEVVREPNLSHGRADLGVFMDGVPNLYVEVGTITSFYKILLNVKAMKNFVYLLVPSDDRLIEFKVKALHSTIPDDTQFDDTHHQFHNNKNLKHPWFG